MAAHVADAPDDGVHFVSDLSVARLIRAERWREGMLLVHEFFVSLARIRVFTVQLRHLRRDELEREFIRLPCFNIETCRPFGLDDTMAVEELEFVLVRMADI